MQILNRENLIDATDGDVSMEAMLYQSFMKTSADYLAQIKEAETAEAKARAIHSMKGVALNMGAEALGEVCRLAEHEDIADSKIEDLHQKTCAEMQQIIDSAE